jgi:seryl-tRNA synthetase
VFPAEDVVWELRRRGDLWETASGLIGLRGDTLALFRSLERRIGALATQDRPEELGVPAGISLRTLARARYYASFPQWLTVASHLTDDADVLGRVAAAGEPEEAIAAATTPPDAALPPAVCYHVYEALADRTLQGRLLLTAQGTCWRHEGERLRPLERGWAFTMREVICIGTADEVEAFRRAGVARAGELAESLGIPFRVEVAGDPFFAPTARGMALLQRLKELKHELLLPIGADRELAAASFNHHESFFGEAFGILLPDGSAAASGCVAFGLERWLLAFLVAHGPDPRDWSNLR